MEDNPHPHSFQTTPAMPVEEEEEGEGEEEEEEEGPATAKDEVAVEELVKQYAANLVCKRRNGRGGGVEWSREVAVEGWSEVKEVARWGGWRRGEGRMDANVILDG